MSIEVQMSGPNGETIRIVAMDLSDLLHRSEPDDENGSEGSFRGQGDMCGGGCNGSSGGVCGAWCEKK